MLFIYLHIYTALHNMSEHQKRDAFPLPPANTPETNQQAVPVVVVQPDDMDIDMEPPELPDYESPDIGYGSETDVIEADYESPCIYESEERECHDFV